MSEVGNLGRSRDVATAGLLKRLVNGVVELERLDQKSAHFSSVAFLFAWVRHVDTGMADMTLTSSVNDNEYLPAFILNRTNIRHLEHGSPFVPGSVVSWESATSPHCLFNEIRCCMWTAMNREPFFA